MTKNNCKPKEKIQTFEQYAIQTAQGYIFVDKTKTR